jgi:hypothetical protein
MCPQIFQNFLSQLKIVDIKKEWYHKKLHTVDLKTLGDKI